jgi:hypothetical protein
VRPDSSERPRQRRRRRRQHWCRVWRLITHRGRAADRVAKHPDDRFTVLLPGRNKQVAKRCSDIIPLLRRVERERVRFVGWHDTTTLAGDRVLALGVPAVPPHSVRRRLAQRGMIAAVIAGGDWGELVWSGGTDADGKERTVRSNGYRHPSWNQAYRDAVVDLMRRRLAHVCTSVTIIADMELGLPLIDGPTPLDQEDVQALEVLGGY